MAARKLVSLASGALLALAPALNAQAVRGTITAAGTGHAISSASVFLVDSTDAVVAQAASDGQGTYTLRAEHPGRFRVRFAAPGYQARSRGSWCYTHGAGNAVPSHVAGTNGWADTWSTY